MSTGTYPIIGIARMGHSGDIRDCRCGFVRMGYIDWDLLSQPSEPKTEQYSNKKSPYSPKTGNYTNSPNILS